MVILNTRDAKKLREWAQMISSAPQCVTENWSRGSAVALFIFSQTFLPLMALKGPGKDERVTQTFFRNGNAIIKKVLDLTPFYTAR
jgi:hypothetical protein